MVFPWVCDMPRVNGYLSLWPQTDADQVAFEQIMCDVFARR